MNAQHIIGQLSDKIFHSEFNNYDNTLDSSDNFGWILAIYNEAEPIDADYSCHNIHQSIDLFLNLANSSN